MDNCDKEYEKVALTKNSNKKNDQNILFSLSLRQR